MPPPVNDYRDGPRDECGVFGIFAPGHDVANLAYFALYALQHRGQESAGIATAPRGRQIMAIRDQGLVAQVFDEHKLRSLVGDMAIGHVRYSTTGTSAWENTQPIVRDDRRTLALAHNGNLINAVDLHAELRERASVQLDIGLRDHRRAARDPPRRADRGRHRRRAPAAEGRVLDRGADRGLGRRVPRSARPAPARARDDRGRGHRPGGYCVASESCAFDLIGAEYLREVLPGEVITLTDGGVQTRMVAGAERRAFCVFEYIYFARPDSQMAGTVLQVARGADGRDPVARGPGRRRPRDPGARLGQPGGARTRARGRATRRTTASSRTATSRGRSSSPARSCASYGLRLKFNPLPEVVAGKRLIVVDDSIVRGNTTRQIVQMLRDAGAAEIHLRISAPPIKHPCHYGIDMSSREEMIAHGRTVDEIADELGADSLHYLSLEGVYEAVGVSRDAHCDACFTGSLSARRHRGRTFGKDALELPLVRA